MDAAWRDAIWQNRHFWDERIADNINPLLGVALLVFLLLAKPPQIARPYLLKSVAALLLVYVLAHLNRWFHLWPSHRLFPSGHTVFAVSVAVSFAMWNRKTLWILVPLLAFYGWLMVALRFHDWLDIFGGLALSWLVTWLVLRGAKKEIVSETPSAPVSSASLD